CDPLAELVVGILVAIEDERRSMKTSPPTEVCKRILRRQCRQLRKKIVHGDVCCLVRRDIEAQTSSIGGRPCCSIREVQAASAGYHVWRNSSTAEEIASALPCFPTRFASFPISTKPVACTCRRSVRPRSVSCPFRNSSSELRWY